MSDLSSPELNLPSAKKDQLKTDKNADKSVKARLKNVAGKAILAGLVLTPGIIHDTKISAPDIENPPLAVAPSPDFKSKSTETLQPYTPQASEQKENKELIPYSPSITIVDAAPSVLTKGLIQKEFISNEKMIRDMLGDNYVSKEQLIQEFGQNYEEKWDEVIAKYPQALTYRLVDTYFGHGENVARVAEDTLERSGLQNTGMNILPLQKIIDMDSVGLIRDASGNPGISLNFDPKRIIELLKNDQSRVINASFQVGNVELFQETKVKSEVIPKYNPDDPRFSGTGLGGMLDGKEVLYQEAVRMNAKDGKSVYYDKEGKEITPITYEELEKRKLENSEVIEHKSTELIIEGAYTKAKAMENLPKLFEVCNAYPDKFFVFAAGNNGEDLREAMETLKDKVPNNLLIVAEWVKAPAYNYEGPAMVFDNEYRLVHGPVTGVEIYGYNKGSNHPHGSSFTVPEFSVEIDKLLKNGLSFEQAKAKILASSDIHILHLSDGTDYTARVFNPSKIQEK